MLREGVERPKGGSVRKTVTDVINSFFNVLLIVMLGRPRFPLIDRTIRDASPAEWWSR